MSQDAELVRCRECEGTGLLLPTRIQRFGIPCPYCHGRGEVHTYARRLVDGSPGA